MKVSTFISFSIWLCLSIKASSGSSLVAGQQGLSNREKRDAAEITGQIKTVTQTAEVILTTFNVTVAVFAQSGSKLAEKLPNIVAKLGPALKVMGSVFGLVSKLTKQDSDVLVALKKGFAEMHLRFDQVSNQIKVLGVKMDYYKSLVPYKEVADSLRKVFDIYVEMTATSSFSGSRDKFINVCGDQEIEPSHAIQKLHRIVVKPRFEDMPHIIHTTIRKMALDYTSIMLFFMQIVNDAVKLATLRSACFGMLNPDDALGMETINTQSEKWVGEIMTTLAKFQMKFTSISAEYYDTLSDDLQKVVDNPQYLEGKKEELNNKCSNEFAKGWKWEVYQAGDICKGKSDVNTVDEQRVAMYSHVTTKYPWLGWTIVVFNKGDQWDCLIKNASKYIHLKNGNDGTNVFVAWSRLTSEIKANVQKASEVMCGTEDITTTWESEVNKCKSLLKEKIPGISKNALFCYFGGLRNQFSKSIYSSGIGIFKSHYSFHHSLYASSNYILHYVITFYED